jgi:hypothetical protein
MLDYYDPTLFTASRWRNGSIHDFGILSRYQEIMKNKDVLRKYAIGYCNAENLICRPKINHKAIMFLKDNYFFWFHLPNNEFKEIYET